MDSISSITSAIDKLNAITLSIASAVEEQTATTDDVSRVIVQSKQGVDRIAQIIENVSRAAGESSAASIQTLSSFKDLDPFVSVEAKSDAEQKENLKNQSWSENFFREFWIPKRAHSGIWNLRLEKFIESSGSGGASVFQSPKEVWRRRED